MYQPHRGQNTLQVGSLLVRILNIYNFLRYRLQLLELS